MEYSTGLADVLPECGEGGNTIVLDENVSQRTDCRAPGRQVQTLDVKPQTTFKPLCGADWLALYRTERLPLQKEFIGELIGFFTTGIGDISQIVHIWAYDSLDDRLERRDRMATDTRWQEFGRKIKSLNVLAGMESRIMRPTDF